MQCCAFTCMCHADGMPSYFRCIQTLGRLPVFLNVACLLPPFKAGCRSKSVFVVLHTFARIKVFTYQRSALATLAQLALTVQSKADSMLRVAISKLRFEISGSLLGKTLPEPVKLPLPCPKRLAEGAPAYTIGYWGTWKGANHSESCPTGYVRVTDKFECRSSAVREALGYLVNPLSQKKTKFAGYPWLPRLGHVMPDYSLTDPPRIPWQFCKGPNLECTQGDKGKQRCSKSKSKKYKQRRVQCESDQLAVQTKGCIVGPTSYVAKDGRDYADLHFRRYGHEMEYSYGAYFSTCNRNWTNHNVAPGVLL